MNDQTARQLAVLVQGGATVKMGPGPSTLRFRINDVEVRSPKVHLAIEHRNVKVIGEGATIDEAFADAQQALASRWAEVEQLLRDMGQL